jgi:hypothetical protein
MIPVKKYVQQLVQYHYVPGFAALLTVPKEEGRRIKPVLAHVQVNPITLI